MSDTPRTDEQINGKPCTRFDILAGDSLRNAAVPSEFARTLEREINASNAIIKQQQLLDEENLRLQERIKRLEDSYAAKDAQLSNLLHICRDNDIEVSSYDLIHGKEAKL